MRSEDRLPPAASNVGPERLESGRVLAFVRCERQPSMKMLRDLARELGTSSEELQQILER